jgi:prepilin-type N-terminal cleavage/methylation domain-containing protein
MKNRQAGFSLIEVLIAIVVITTGLLALSGALVVGVTLPARARQQELAKQLANSIMESIIAAKEAPRAGFTSGLASISYTTDPNTPGRFVAGVTSMLTPGPDGVYGTCDDGTAGAFNPNCPGLGAQVVTVSLDPGADGDYSTTGDNLQKQLLDFTRQVIITDLTPPPVSSKQIEVRVYYNTPTGSREMVSLICQLTEFTTL